MTTTSYGFAGSLGAADWAKMARYVGPYGVLGTTDWAVTAVSGQRAVSVAAGEAFGWNVRSVSDTAQTVTLPTPSAGQWYLIVATRNWAAKTTTVNYVPADTTGTTTPTTAPAALPAATNQTPGTTDDQPLAWAWVNNTSTAVTVVDLRTPVADLQQPRFGASTEAASSLAGAFAGQFAFASDSGATYRWNGSGWKIWDRPQVPIDEYGAGTNGGGPNVLAAGLTELNVGSGVVEFNFALYRSGGIGAGIPYFVLTPNFRPSATVYFGCMTENNDNTSSPAVGYIDNNGGVFLLANGGTACSGFRGTAVFRAA